MKSTFFLLTIVGLFFFPHANLNADLVWTFTEDGNGNIRETISGSLNLAGGTDLGSTGAGGQFQLVKFGGTDEVSVGRYTTQTSGRSWGVILNGYDTNPDFELINTDFQFRC